MLLKPRAVKEDIALTSNTSKQSDVRSGAMQQSAKPFSGEYLTIPLVALLTASDVSLFSASLHFIMQNTEFYFSF